MPTSTARWLRAGDRQRRALGDGAPKERGAGLQESL
jgi:hypothetical protein